MFNSQVTKIFGFIAVVLGFFIALLDTTIVSITLPKMMNEFGTDISTISWVVSAYNLVFGSLLVTISRIADQHGRKKIFIWGVILFIVTSFLCGISKSVESLILFRALQGLASAMVVPVTVPLAVHLFSESKSGLVIGIWAAISGFAAAIGPSLGGIIAQNYHWGWIFFINIPIGIISIVMTMSFIEESIDPTASKHPDIGGTLTIILGTFALSYALIQSNEWGWGDPRIISLFIASAVLYTLFFINEKKCKEPMIPLELLKNIPFVAGNATLFLIGVGTMDGIFFLSFYMTEIMGLTELDAGITVSVIALSSIGSSLIGGALSDKMRSRNITIIGMLIFCGALYLYSTLDYTATKADLIPKMILAGAGLGLTLSTVVTSTIKSVSVEKTGMASGIGNMSRVIGHVFGAAIIVAIFNNALDTQLERAIPEAKKIVAASSLKDEVKEVVYKRIDASLESQHSHIPTLAEVEEALSKKEKEAIDAATPFKKPFVKAAFKKQRAEIERIFPELSVLIKKHAAQAYSYTFLLSCILLLSGVITSAFTGNTSKKSV